MEINIVAFETNLNALITRIFTLQTILQHACQHGENRDLACGKFVRLVSGYQLLQYPDEEK